MYTNIHRKISRYLPVVIIGLIAAFGTILLVTSQGETAEIPRSTGQTIYVPAYSHIYSGAREQSIYLAVTLSLRNTDPHSPITITSVDYYDTDGQLEQRYLDAGNHSRQNSGERYV